MSASDDQTTLVTGGAGFIGTNLVRTLVDRGEDVVVLDNEFLGTMKNLDGVDCQRVRGDAADAALLARVADEHPINRVVHLAGYTSAPMYSQDTPQRILANYEQFLSVLELARNHDLPVAYASTSSFYARCEKPFREDMRILPATPYELSKFTMEQAAHTYWHEYGVRANGLRFFSVYGPYEEHKGRYANNISQFFWSIANGVRPIVFGDGTQTRDFTYVGDLVEAIIMIIKDAEGSEVYNIGTGVEHSFNDMIDVVNDTLGTDVKPRYVDNPLKNYVQETLADTSKLEREIGWTSSTSLEQGVKILAEVGTSFTKEDAEGLYDWISAPAV